MTRTVLQRVELNPSLEIARLYHRERQVRDIGAPVKAGPEGLHVPQQAAVTFDTYFGAFYENHWFGYTGLQSVLLRVGVDGDCVVSVWRQTPERDQYLLRQERVQGRGDVEFQFDHDDELRVEAGRLWFEVEALGETVVLSADWSSFDTPVRAVSMSVVFCTFNRQKYLQRILRSIDADDRAIASVSRVIVVNQGESFSPEEIVGPDTTGRLLDKLTIIEQPNMGGCGGFTRGMYETVADDELSHFLVMDDDSRISAESVARTADFLSFSDENVVVGGHMLNLHRPNRLFEAGAMLDQATLQPTPIHHNADLGVKRGLEPFLRSGAVTYNGWWMFGASASIIEQIGYPMPCFIRGDDMEFGLRIRDSNLRTLPVPGIGVWHEPFYLKLGGWQFFFEVRNRLAMAALHDHPDFPGIRRDLRKVFARDIAMCRYHSCQLMIAAIRAYAAGPEVALDTTDGPLRDAAAIVSEFGPERVEVAAHAPSKVDDLQDRGELRRMLETAKHSLERRLGKVVLAQQIARRLLQAEGGAPTELPVLRAADLKPHSIAKYDGYVVVEDYGGEAWKFRRNRGLERELWRELVSLQDQIAFDPRYKSTFDETNRFEDLWRGIFASVSSA